MKTINIDSENLKLRGNPNVSFDDAKEMYSCYGAHISTEEHGDICVQAVDYEWLDDDKSETDWRNEALSALDKLSEGDFSACDDKPNDLADALARGDEEDMQAWIDYLRADDYPDEGLESVGSTLADEIESALEQVREINQWADRAGSYAACKLKEGDPRLAWDDIESLVDLAKRVRGDMEPIAELLEQAASAAVDGDLQTCLEALRGARDLETDHGDDPSTSGLAAQLLEEIPVYRLTEKFTTPPENQGQIVTYSYGLAADDNAIIMSVYDGSDRSQKYYAYKYPDDDDGSWEPWNGAPELGEEIGECTIDEENAERGE